VRIRLELVIRTPRRDSRWWEVDEVVTLIDAVAMTGLQEADIDALVRDGTVGEIELGGIRYYRRADLVAIGPGKRGPKPPID
jgi:hypothetical protein